MGIYTQWLARAFVLLVVFATAFGDSGTAYGAIDPEAITLGGEVRERYEYRNNADFNDTVNDTLSFVGSRIRLGLNYEVTSDITTFIQLQDSRIFGGEVSTASNDQNVDLHQGYISVKNVGPTSLILGRQELFFGDQRLVGNFGWSNIGRSFDGLRVTYLSAPVRVDAWAATPKVYGTNTSAAPGFGPSNREHQGFFGVYASVKTLQVTLEPYAMYLLDGGNADEAIGGNLVSPITAPAARGQNRVTLGLRATGKTLADAVDFTGEAAYQMGSMDARGATPKSDISANAVALKAGYTAAVSMKPRIGIEYDRASGDSDPNDDKYETFENLFPTNHIHYGDMDYVGWRNMQAIRVSLSAKPSESSGVSLDFYRFSLVEASDRWYSASGAPFGPAPTAGNSETDLGQEIDLVAYLIVKEKVRFEAGYSRFLPGDYVDVNFPASDPSDWFYVQAGVSF